MAEEISNERWRLFVAIAIPEAVRDDMVAVQRELKPLALEMFAGRIRSSSI